MSTPTVHAVDHALDTSSGLNVSHHKQFLSYVEHDALFTELKNYPWFRVKYNSERHANDCETPCWTNFFGGFPEMKPYQPVPPLLLELSRKVALVCGENCPPFNAVLLRLYFDGSDNITWHTDGRSFLGESPIIASLSLGASTKFQMRKMTNVWPTKGCPNGGIDKTQPHREFILKGGDMIVMAGATQKHWHHRVPKEPSRGVRININFRYILPQRSEIAYRGVQAFYKYMVSGDDKTEDWEITAPSFTYDEICKKKAPLLDMFRKGIAGVNACEVKQWECQTCTFLNESLGPVCSMCGESDRLAEAGGSIGCNKRPSGTSDAPLSTLNTATVKNKKSKSTIDTFFCRKL